LAISTRRCLRSIGTTNNLADLGDTYANAAPDLFDGLQNAVTTARTLNEQQANIDQALMAAVGLGNTGGEVFEHGAPTSCVTHRTYPHVAAAR
jgi:ABC-type transporter Mla subunit MlaD